MRHYQVSKSRVNSSLSHQNSFDGRSIKRRPSKERITIPKMIDMKKEKEDLMHSFERVDEEVASSSVQPLQPSSDARYHSGSSSSPTNTNTIVDINTSGAFTPPNARSDTNSSGLGSPKGNRRGKGEISQRMLAKLNIFETSNSASSGAVSTTPALPHTSTPISSPPASQIANGSTECKFYAFAIQSTPFRGVLLIGIATFKTLQWESNTFSLLQDMVSLPLKLPFPVTP